MVSSRPNDLTPADRATDLAPGARTGHVRVQAAVVSSGLSCSDLIGERMPIELWRRVRLWNTSIQSKTSVESSTRVVHLLPLSSSVGMRPQKLSTTALSKASPTVPRG